MPAMLVLRSARATLRPTCLRSLAVQGRYQSTSDKPQVSREVTGAGGSPKPSQPLPSLTPDASSPREMQQSPNYLTTWSTSQNPRGNATAGPRFEQVDMELQATPFSAMAKVAEDPVRLVEGRRAACDGGKAAIESSALLRRIAADLVAM